MLRLVLLMIWSSSSGKGRTFLLGGIFYVVKFLLLFCLCVFEDDGPTNGQTDEQRKLCNCLIGRQVGIGRIGKDEQRYV